jgi:hypothetical protein
MMRRYAAVTDKTLRAAAEAVSGNTRPVATGSGNGPLTPRNEGVRRNLDEVGVRMGE